jgi:S-adenosylmethionine hydrolase
MPILSLTSDIGHKDFLVGAVKGQILQVNESFNIVDISHDLTPFNYPQAAMFAEMPSAIFRKKVFI